MAAVKAELLPIAERLGLELEATTTDWDQATECVEQLHERLGKPRRLCPLLRRLR